MKAILQISITYFYTVFVAFFFFWDKLTTTDTVLMNSLLVLMKKYCKTKKSSTNTVFQRVNTHCKSSKKKKLKNLKVLLMLIVATWISNTLIFIQMRLHILLYIYAGFINYSVVTNLLLVFASSWLSKWRALL